MSDETKPTLVSLTAVIRCPCGEAYEFDDLAGHPTAEFVVHCDCGRWPAISPGDPIVQFAFPHREVSR
jgi:hypothetical protein